MSSEPFLIILLSNKFCFAVSKFLFNVCFQFFKSHILSLELIFSLMSLIIFTASNCFSFLFVSIIYGLKVTGHWSIVIGHWSLVTVTSIQHPVSYIQYPASTIQHPVICYGLAIRSVSIHSCPGMSFRISFSNAYSGWASRNAFAENEIPHGWPMMAQN